METLSEMFSRVVSMPSNLAKRSCWSSLPSLLNSIVKSDVMCKIPRISRVSRDCLNLSRSSSRLSLVVIRLILTTMMRIGMMMRAMMREIPTKIFGTKLSVDGE